MGSIDAESFCYRPFVIKIYRVVVWSLVISILAILRFNIYEILQGTWYSGIVKFILASTVPLSILLRLIFYIRPQIFSTYQLYTDRIVQEYKNHEKEIRFDSIKSIKILPLPPRFFGGFSLSLKSGQKFLFLSLLEKNHIILERVMGSNKNLLNENKAKTYLKQAKLVEISWSRILNGFKNWKLALFKFIIYPLLLAILLFNLKPEWFDRSQLNSFEVIIVNFVFIFLAHSTILILINLIEEKILNERLVEEQGMLKLNAPLEKNIFILGQVLFFILSILIFYFILKI